MPEGTDLQLRVCQQLVPGRDWLSVYRTDWDSVEVYDDLVPESTEALQDILVPAFAATPRRDGTRPEKFFAAAARATGRSVILYCTDGDVDEPPAQAEAALRKVGTALAGNENIKRVVLVGVTPGNRALWRRCFAPLDASGRLSLLTLSPETPDRVSDLIAAAR